MPLGPCRRVSRVNIGAITQALSMCERVNVGAITGLELSMWKRDHVGAAVNVGVTLARPQALSMCERVNVGAITGAVDV